MNQSVIAVMHYFLRTFPTLSEIKLITRCFDINNIEDVL